MTANAHERAKADSRGYFDGEAASYESDRRWRRVLHEQLRALAALELAAGDRLLDVGCGSGAAVREAAALVERAVGLDLSPGMIEEARRLAENVPGAEFVVGDAESLPFAADEFTAVLCSASLHHYPDPGRAIEEMVRVLAPGGRVAISDANPEQLFMRFVDRRFKRNEPGHLGFLQPQEIVRLLAAVGLAETEIRRFHHQGFAIALARKPG